MFRSIALMFLCLLSFAGMSQELSFIRIGAGIPVFTKPFFPNYGEPERFSEFKSTIFIEKSNLFPGLLQYNLSINPGFSYFNMKQYEGPGSALGGGSELDLKRCSFSGYIKFLYHPPKSQNNKLLWYAGTIAGVQLIRKTEGEYSWWMKQPDGYASGGKSINQLADDFFNPFYVGFKVGISPARNSDQFLKPGIEFSFYPDFIINEVKSYGSYARRGNLSTAVVSVVFGIGK